MGNLGRRRTRLSLLWFLAAAACGGQSTEGATDAGGAGASGAAGAGGNGTDAATPEPDAASGDGSADVSSGADVATNIDAMTPDSSPDVVVPTSDASCIPEPTFGQLKVVGLYLMTDSSGSMDMIDTGQTLSRWENLAQAIPTFVNHPASAGLNVGLDFFPEDGVSASCNVSDYTMANVPIDNLPGMNNMQANAIVAAVQGRARAGGTPTVPALTGALQTAKTWLTTSPRPPLSVVFLTDGQPSGCQGNTVDAAAQVAQTYAVGTPPVKTYVLGIGPDTGNLDAIAAAGGTRMAYMATTGTAAEIANALAAIRKSTQQGCEYDYPQIPGGALDPGRVNVRIGTAAMPQDLYDVGSSAGCTDPTTNPKGEGWYYDSLPAPTKMLLCANSCAQLQTTDGSTMSMLLGCPTKPLPPPT